mmetsp:Transcript_41040/g.127904  ORF Transcript_41040/g.127904 Transcript_41040/m.127904 type:complete len:280 (-) Transcript_41040:187-1026(-)
MADGVEVAKGTKEMTAQAEKGMELFKQDAQDELTFDVAAATAFKEQQEAAIKAKEDLAATLTGKDNKKQRSEVSKEISAMKTDAKYIDALKVVKGLPPPQGNFVVKTEAPKAAPEEVAAPAEEASKVNGEAKAAPKKDEKKAKKIESAGLSKAERDELEKLKADIIKRKAELKEQGLSGGQCNKDPEVVAWVARMQELKIKEDSSLADEGKDKGKGKDIKKSKGALTESEQKDMAKLETDLEEYRLKLIQEFGYSKKDIAADPDFKEMSDRLAALKKRA